MLTMSPSKGPTAFPIMFAAILSQFMTAIASNRLEKGTSIGLLEYLLRTRSLGSAALAVFKLKMLNVWLPLILIAWFLSPLGGQASLRLVSSGVGYVNVTAKFHYLDTTHSPPSYLGANDMEYMDPAIYNAFNGALGSPGSLKNSSQDMYGNIHIPQLSSLTVQPSPDGWYDVRNTQGPYVSLIGVPFIGADVDTNSSFTLETSYMSLDCDLKLGDITDLADWNGTVGCTNCAVYSSGWPNLQDGSTNHEDDLSTAGKIGLLSSPYDEYRTEAWCDATTTYVEAAVECLAVSSNCSVVAIRKSITQHPPETQTFLDCIYLEINNGCDSLIRSFFFHGLLSAVTPSHPGDPSTLESYFLSPDSPFSGGSFAPIGGIGNELFATRFAQLLNTFWLAYVAPFAVTGDFSINSSTYANSTGIKQTSHPVLKYHHGWAICLVLISSLLILASLTTAVLEANRRGPSVLDTFISSQMNNPYVQIERKEAMEDGVDVVTRSRNKKIKLGDVAPLDEVGRVAVATPEKLQPVDVLRRGRVYQ